MLPFIICMCIALKRATEYRLLILCFPLKHLIRMHDTSLETLDKHYLYYIIDFLYFLSRGELARAMEAISLFLIPDNSCIYAQHLALCKGVGRITTTALTDV